MIKIENIVKVYTTGEISLTALKGVSLNIGAGEFVSIMGPSGCGKSTLMNVLGCLDKMTSGKYILNGKDISDLTDNELAEIRCREIGFVFQSFNLLPRMTILENVELPMIYAGIPKKERREKALAALERVDLSNRIKHRPNEISGGQKQRVAIARAIVNNPSIILADEPTGNLDSKTGTEILELFKRINKEKGKTIVQVTHSHEAAQYGTRIINVKDGRVWE